MAGTAMTSPTKAVTSPARKIAMIQGTPQSVVACAIAAPPTAASAVWQRETWPDILTSRPIEANRITYSRPKVHTLRAVPTHAGISARSPMNSTAKTTRTRAGA